MQLDCRFISIALKAMVTSAPSDNETVSMHILKALDHCAIFSATLLLQLHSTPSLMLILSLMKSHHIGDSAIFYMLHYIISIETR